MFIVTMIEFQFKFQIDVLGISVSDISVDISVRALMFSNLNTHAEHYRSDTQSL